MSQSELKYLMPQMHSTSACLALATSNLTHVILSLSIHHSNHSSETHSIHRSLEARNDTHVSSVLETGVLPEGCLLPVGRGKAGLDPEEDNAWQAQQLQGLFDEGLDEDEGHEEGGGLRGGRAQGVDDPGRVVCERCDLVQDRSH